MRGNYRISRVTTPASSLALITLDQAKGALGIALTDTSQDAAITQQVEQVSMAINNYCDRIFVVQSYRDQFRSRQPCLTPGEPLRMRQYPIVVDVDGAPVLTVAEDGTALDTAFWEADIATGQIYKLDAAWTSAVVIVDYDGGYDPIPSDVQAAALDWLVARWGAQGRDPLLRSETIPDVISQTWATADMSSTSVPPAARDYLASYRNWSV